MSSCSNNKSAINNESHSWHTDLDTKPWMMRSLQQWKLKEKKTKTSKGWHKATLPTRFRYIHCIWHSNEVVLNVSQRKEKKKRYNSTPYSTGATWLRNIGNNWFNKCLKIKVSGFTVYTAKIHFLNMCSSRRVHSIKTTNLCKRTIPPSYFLTLRDFLDKVPLRGPLVLGYWIKTPLYSQDKNVSNSNYTFDLRIHSYNISYSTSVMC